MKKNNSLHLKSLSSANVELSSWYPENLDDIFACLDIEVAWGDTTEGTNLFYVSLSTPEALRKHREGPILVENRTIIISDYNYRDITLCIQNILDKCSRDSWDESCKALLKYFQWEYEDYQDDN